MYDIKMVSLDINVENDAIMIEKVTPLIKSVLGYNDTDINNMKTHCFSRTLATKLTLEQVKLVVQPFYDIDAPILIKEYNDNTKEYIDTFSPRSPKLGLTKQTPKEHYCDKPVISREHLIAPDYVPSKPTIDITPRPTSPTITCPYCQSTNTKKISGLSKAVSVGIFGIFALGKTTKQFHCNNCKADF